ncbi:MAG: transposase [Candidatus Methanoperedens nitroreducens]|uniref:Transposase n=1 Tax=Candidatus Methanoperedens nitratireducens TaxID=1392998 RepID=A0A0P8A6Q8_9EURY|nr:MAG: transposase [Candidatus Methanoperedens sp. BLZ1]
MYIERTTRKTATKTHECFMLRESYRENGKIRKRTIANISHLSAVEIDALKAALRYKQPAVPLSEMSMQTGKIVGSLMVVREIAKKLGIDFALGSSRKAALCLWLIFARLVEQGSRLSSVRLAERHDCSLLGLKSFDENDLYDALTWVSEEQETIQQALFKTRYGDKEPRLFLYDVTSSYLEGMDNQLSWWGYNRDGKKGKKQIVFGLLTDELGEPIAVEVFKGNTADPATFVELVTGFGKRFGVSEVIFVGDRGMIKKLGIEALQQENFKYITGITTAQIKTLLKEGIIQLNLFDSELHEVTDGDLRYVFRKNPIRAVEVSGARNDKLARLRDLAQRETQYLTEHAKATEEKAVERVESMAEKLKLQALVKIEAASRQIKVSVDEKLWQEASQLDGCYVLKTDVPATELDVNSIHARYKDLAKVERGFRTIKTGLLEVRPIWLRDEAKTKGHVFICMLAYMISRELKTLTTGEETVQDLIADLNMVTELKITVGKETIVSLPRPPDKAALIAAQLGITF